MFNSRCNFLSHHRLAQIEIQRAERLVEQEHSRSADQGARQCDTLLLTPGQIARPARREARKPHHLKHLPNAPVSRALFHALHLQAELDVLKNRAMGKQREALEHHRGIAMRWRQVGYISPGDEDLPFGRFFETADHAQYRRLAAAGRPEQRDKLTVLQLGIEVDDRPDSAGKGLVGVFQYNVELSHRLALLLRCSCTSASRCS
jgi:hypothetical protein